MIDDQTTNYLLIANVSLAAVRQLLPDSWVARWDTGEIILKTPKREWVESFCGYLFLAAAGFLMWHMPNTSVFWVRLIQTLFAGSLLGAVGALAGKRTITFDLTRGTYLIEQDVFGKSKSGALSDINKIGLTRLALLNNITSCVLYLNSGRKVWIGTYLTKKPAVEFAGKLSEALGIQIEPVPTSLPWTYRVHLEF